MRMTQEEYDALMLRKTTPKDRLQKHIEAAGFKPKSDKRGNPNKTESEYQGRLQLEFPGCSIEFEALSIKMSNGHTYTPDWVVKGSDGHILCVETKHRGKNGFRHPSYQRAKLAFDQCRVEWPMFSWRWAEKEKGEWNVKDF